MAGKGLYQLASPVFLNGVLISGTWTPSEPRLVVTARSSAKNRYQVYPFIRDDIDGTAVFIELTITISYARVALTFQAAAALQAGIESVALNEAENRNTTGSYREDKRYVGSYTHEYSVETKTETLVSWTEGPPPEEGE